MAHNIPFNSTFSVTALFGDWNQGLWGKKGHQGIDLVCRVNGNPGNIICNMPSGRVLLNETGNKYFGNWVKIQEDNSSRVHMYCHMAVRSPLKVSQSISRGEFIGIMGATGNVTGPHLHYQIEVNGVPIDPAAYLTIPAVTGAQYNPLRYPVIGDVITDTPAFSGDDFTDSGTVEDMQNAETAKLLKETEGVYSRILNMSADERKYGVSAYDITQSMIKTTSFTGVKGKTGGNANSVTNALLKYSRFLYYLLNSSIKTASIQMIGAPWIRPGVNVWVDPLFIDKVYYVNRVTHTGNPDGVYTSLELSFGRDRSKFASSSLNQEDDFGSMSSSGGSSGNDNVFVNKISKPISTLGKAILSKSEFENLKKYTEIFYNSETKENIKALNNPFFLKFYNEKDIDKTAAIKGYAGDVGDVQWFLNNKYTKAPPVVQSRQEALRAIVQKADEYIKTHYVTPHL